ncbi:MAG TPA: hypothetical protein VEN79_01090 [Terriglobia bacterium]|nr:hypothetical protein [Terriglobia bacterium]
MSVNQYQQHVFVLPEDEANLQIANGFHLQVPLNRQRQMQVLPVARGWPRVLELFQSVHVSEMERNFRRSMVLLIDFDGKVERLTKAKAVIPGNLADRVFILGAFTTPEALRQANLGTYENIGLAMAKDCREETNIIWGHELLQHNSSELDRLREHVRPILFPSDAWARPD